ncbi:3-oxoadipyl-CoA thiolase [Pseudoalteromonas sp. S1612]|uniref:3-oxoadipyl-CoA thiolase n=1 Tax=Pseudoalteromonas sp. S1612 TaxID=579507 RepID=UPI00110A2B05|nr:3-oxoadipyl-CoA thiolase [Pseudoalteromonas sp. S1612]TMP57045.1 3-oxoadipyl-CoA thiolase [Pseudoalteromonas sp. S1612]
MKVFICSPKRSAIGRYSGKLACIRPDDLLAQVIKSVIEDSPDLDPCLIDDAIFGCANQAGEDNRNIARMSVLLSGLPATVSATTINRLCGSGMDAIGSAFRAILSREADICIAGGVESMSRAPFVMGKAAGSFDRSQKIEDTTMGWRFVNHKLDSLYGTETMPETAENVAERFGISRDDQDKFALASQEKAYKAQQSGRFAKEIVPVYYKSNHGEVTQINDDEHLRPNTDIEKLKKLKAPFRDGGSVTAGNASGLNDGAAAMIIASESAALKNNLVPIARIVGMATAGVEPTYMGIGPVDAVNKLLARTGLTLEDMSVIELNEAFAAQALACIRELGLQDNDKRINPNGGAIALGHPLGMSGARLIQTAAVQLQETSGRYALCTMCIGVGQGIAMIIEKV